MCASVDRLGASAPWRAYMHGYLREAEDDNTAYGEASDRSVALAWMRGRLRLASAVDAANATGRRPHTHVDALEEPGDESDLAAPIDWGRVAAWVESNALPMPGVIAAVADTYDSDGVIRLIHALEKPGEACLEFAEKLAKQPPPDDRGIPSPRTWAVAALAHGVQSGSTHRVLKLGVNPDCVTYQSTEVARERLLELTRPVQERSVQWESGHLGAWLDATSLAAYLDEDVLRTAEVLRSSLEQGASSARSNGPVRMMAGSRYLLLNSSHRLTPSYPPSGSSLTSCYFIVRYC